MRVSRSARRQKNPEGRGRSMCMCMGKNGDEEEGVDRDIGEYVKYGVTRKKLSDSTMVEFRFAK